MTEQQQKGGARSTNIQAQVIQVGLGYADVRQIAQDVFEANFGQLANVAKGTASERASELRDAIDVSLAKKTNDELASFSQPEKQVALYDAQKAYALSGDAGQRDMLVSMVSALAGQTEHSFKSIVIQEAIKILPSLTANQLRLLTIIFAVRQTRNDGSATVSAAMKNLAALLPFDVGSVKASEGEFRHLEFTRCVVVQTFQEAAFTEVMKQHYQGLFSSGFTEQDLNTRFGTTPIPPGCVMKCLNDPTKFQIAAVNERVLQAKSDAGHWTEEQTKLAQSLLTQNQLGDDAISDLLAVVDELAPHLRQMWGTSQLKSATLTSVAIAVAHTYVASVGVPIAPLDIWIE